MHNYGLKEGIGEVCNFDAERNKPFLVLLSENLSALYSKAALKSGKIAFLIRVIRENSCMIFLTLMNTNFANCFFN